MGVRLSILQPKPPDRKLVAFPFVPRGFGSLSFGSLRFWTPRMLKLRLGVPDFSESASGLFGSAYPVILLGIDWQWKAVEKV